MHDPLHPADTGAPHTLEQAMQQLAAKERAFTQFKAVHEGMLRAVSHDLRAPLRHLTSFTPLLREAVDTLSQATPGEAADEAQEFLHTMEQSARKMGAMLDALMQLSRALQQPLDLMAVDVRRVLQSCAERVQPPLQSQGWSLPAQPVWLQADSAALHAVLEVLLSNAAKFSATQPVPQVQVNLSMPTQACWRIEVCDNGVGFDASRMDTSWPPFQRMHRESDFPGVGCGLALAHTLVQRQAASLQLLSHPGQGCTAVLEWPAALQ